MPAVLTTASSIVCGHSGTVQQSSSEKLKVNGNSVLIKSSVDGQSISGCQTLPAVDSSGTETARKCTKVAVDPPAPPGPGVTGGEAVKLKVNGKPVMLSNLTGNTNGMVAKVTPQNLLSATAGQTKLTAI